jgi:HAD superfamily hydrolase (TIGR01509 family)
MRRLWRGRGVGLRASCTRPAGQIAAEPPGRALAIIGRMKIETMNYVAVLFDCDGVLVDSEPITNGVLRDMLEERGWAMTQEECEARFIGRAVRDQRAEIEARTGLPFTEEWLQSFYVRRNAALEARLTAIAHIHDTVARVHRACGGRLACASGADRGKVELQLRKVGLYDYFEGRIFSGHETPRSKPHPDVYLAAAAALGVAAEGCAVVEDTVAGVLAGVAAGARVFAYAPVVVDPGRYAAQQAALLHAGAAQLFADMRELPGLLAR